MARQLRPFVEREALWAIALAALGFVSMDATLPAAVVLAARVMRRPGGGDGSEPAMAWLAFGLSWLSFLLAYPVMRALVISGLHTEATLPWAVLGGIVLLALLIVRLANFAVHIHPERWVARRSAVLGIAVASVAAGLQVTAAIMSAGGLSVLIRG